MALATRICSVCRPCHSSPLSATNDEIRSFHFKPIQLHNSPPSTLFKIRLSLRGDAQRCRSKLESMFHCDKPIPEEIIEKPIGLSLDERDLGDNPHCVECEAKGAVLCTTCSGSGLYIDSILESQGIIVKVRCLGCGGIGNVMCLVCGGRGHK